MKLKLQQKISLLVILLSVIILPLISIVDFGKHLSRLLPCTTNPQDSIYCYSSYNAFAYIALGLAIAICVVGLSIDLIRRLIQSRHK